MNKSVIESAIYSTIYENELIVDKKRLYLLDKDAEELLTLLNYENDKVKFYCSKCKDDESFTHNIFFYAHKSHIPNSFVVQLGNRKSNFTQKEIFEYDNEKLYINKILIDNDYIFRIIYTCNLNNNHIVYAYFMIRVENSRLSIIKIGQSVSPYEIGLVDAQKYNNQLKLIDGIDDYRKIFLHKVYGDYIASLLYTRRVFEKLINYLLDEVDILIENKDNRVIKFREKIDLLKESKVLDPEITSLSPRVYNLLSSGIHQLTDSECEELYKPLKTFIDLQLLYFKAQQDRKKMIEEMSGKLS
jgi:hypothetical protein